MKSTENRSRLIKLIIIALVVLCISVLIWSIPELLLPSSRNLSTNTERIIGIRNEYRKIIAQIIGGAVVLYGIYNTLIRIESIEKNIEIAQEGQITDRFTKAIEQLGHGNIEMKIGGIYALERISQDSLKDYWSIIEILTAYLRRTSSVDSVNSESEYVNDSPPRLPIEVQTALNVISRRKRFDLEVKQNRNPDLSLTNLKNAYLGKANLQFSDLSDANLEGANLKEANLLNAKGLTINQLSNVKTLYGARLSQSLEAKIKQQYPRLFQQ